MYVFGCHKRLWQMMKINVDACSYRVINHSVYEMFFNHVGEHKQQSMKEQIIVAQLQSQTTCSYILHYHCNKNTFKLSS